ncbi:DgyrCDS12281 [Dimorphilus gyrociliatus]|uniref:DgyrCDS12281 n=1 Tax=Dimorphilus gyrociliatus TaxID=2664684 RepID=A0A7I8W606_9ANNE|nr:DgyrCDS12281 [Dimorphilus gyrociliatus]
MRLVKLLLLLTTLAVVTSTKSRPDYSLIPRKRKAVVPDEQRLLETILYDYNTAARPVYNASKTVTVKFGLTLTQIADMDEVNQVLTTNVWLEQEWTDERLTWDPSDYNGLEVLRIPCQRIWLPDIVLYNSADDFTEGFMQTKAMVTSKGNVFWPPPAKLRSSCKIDITYFPFDDQKCHMKFGSWTYDGHQVDITNRSEVIDLDNYVFSGEWQLLYIKMIRNEVHYGCCDEPYPDVTFYIVMRRRTLYYLFNIIFPCLWLTVLSLLGFWLPPDSGEKITLGITVLLAFSVFMLLIAESMPATSEFVPLIGIYLTVTMAMTSLSIVLTVFVLQLHHVGPHQKAVPLLVRKLVIEGIGRLLCMKSHLKHYYTRQTDQNRADEIALSNLEDQNNGRLRSHVPDIQVGSADRNVSYDGLSNHLRILVSKSGDEDDMQDIINDWRLVAHIMDRFLFWLFLIGSFLSSITILVFCPLTKPAV